MRISDWSSDVCSSRAVWPGRSGTALDCRAAAPLAMTKEGEMGSYQRRLVLSKEMGARIPVRAHFLWLTVHFNSRRRCRRSEEHTSELQSLMRISYAVFCLKKKTTHKHHYT